MRNTFTRQHRLLAHRSFRGVLAVNDLYIKSFWRVNALGHGRVGWYIPKKLVKLAVDRNCLKRLIRDTFREHEIKQLEIDILIRIQHSFVVTQKNEWAAIFRQLWNDYALLVNTVN